MRFLHKIQTHAGKFVNLDAKTPPSGGSPEDDKSLIESTNKRNQAWSEKIKDFEGQECVVFCGAAHTHEIGSQVLSDKVIGFDELLRMDKATSGLNIRYLYFPSLRSVVNLPGGGKQLGELRMPQIVECGPNQSALQLSGVASNTSFLGQIYKTMLLFQLDAESKGLEGEEADEYVNGKLQEFSEKVEILSRSGAFEYDSVDNSMSLIRDKAKEAGLLCLYKEISGHFDELLAKEDIIENKLRSLTVTHHDSQQLETARSNTSSRSNN